MEEELNTTIEELTELWGIAEEEGSSEHTTASLQIVVRITKSFVADLRGLDGIDQMDSAVRQTVSELNQLNTSFGNALLETDERDILVTFINNCCELSGFSLDHYEYRDATLRYRDF